MSRVWWKYSENVAAGKTVNVAVAGYVTIRARLKLYVYLRGLGESELYSDTDSVICMQKLVKPQK